MAESPFRPARVAVPLDAGVRTREEEGMKTARPGGQYVRLWM